MNDIQVPKLRDEINRGLDYGCFDLTKKTLVSLCDGDLGLGLLLLKQWETRGLLRIDLNPVLAEDDDICVHMIGVEKSP